MSSKLLVTLCLTSFVLLLVWKKVEGYDFDRPMYSRMYSFGKKRGGSPVAHLSQMRAIFQVLSILNNYPKLYRFSIVLSQNRKDEKNHKKIMFIEEIRLLL